MVWSGCPTASTQAHAEQKGLSAGEAQLLALSRVFLRDPGLVIMDEASSRADPATERLIQRATERLWRGRTAVIIAHRLATVKRADEILILEDGRIAERGARARLAADPNAHFARLLYAPIWSRWKMARRDRIRRGRGIAADEGKCLARQALLLGVDPLSALAVSGERRALDRGGALAVDPRVAGAGVLRHAHWYGAGGPHRLGRNCAPAA